MNRGWRAITAAVLIIALAFTTVTFAYADQGGEAVAGVASPGAATDGERATEPDDEAPLPEEPGGGKQRCGQGGDDGICH